MSAFGFAGCSRKQSEEWFIEVSRSVKVAEVTWAKSFHGLRTRAIYEQTSDADEEVTSTWRFNLTQTSKKTHRIPGVQVGFVIVFNSKVFVVQGFVSNLTS